VKRGARLERRRGSKLEATFDMAARRRTTPLLLLAALLAATSFGCAGSAADQGDDGELEASEGALIPATLFSATCTVSIPADDGTVDTAHVSGRFRVGAGGTLSAADSAPVHVAMPGGKDESVKLRQGRVIDAEHDVFELTVAYGLFSVGVHYDGTHASSGPGSIRLEVPLKGTSTYAGTCAFEDESGQPAGGKVGARGQDATSPSR
jgi:hypothetical protein